MATTLLLPILRAGLLLCALIPVRPRCYRHRRERDSPGKDAKGDKCTGKEQLSRLERGMLPLLACRTLQVLTKSRVFNFQTSETIRFKSRIDTYYENVYFLNA